jgi:tetratricopeptide (TPR) repeat protein
MPSTLDSSAIYFVITFSLVLFSESAGQNIFENGKTYYKQRDVNADSFRADPEMINKAINAFEKSLDQNINPEESASYLLQAYYFKGMFTGMPEEEQKEIYEKGRSLGEKMMDKFPNSVPIKFWYSANIGRWAKVHGFLKAATSGVAKKLRRVCKDIIELDRDYQGGGGYRILAQVHYHAPNIPILMGWPSDEKALELIENAMEIAPDHPTNRMLYAEILLEFDRDEEAKKQLQFILDMEPRPTHTVEDQYLKHRSRLLFDQYF